MKKNKVLIPLPSFGCDPSEVAIPWKILSQKGFEIVFATPNGKMAETDPIMLTGKRLGIMKPILAARQDAAQAFLELEETKSFKNPIKWEDINPNDFNGIILPGGHDKPVKEYLESALLQKRIVHFFNENKPVGAICHGVVLVARSINPDTNKSVLFDYKTTALLKSQELLGYQLTRLWLKDYYLTYPGLTVEDEVKEVLKDKGNFIQGSTPLLRDTPNKLKRGFIVKDRNYVSGRWPGDVYNFSLEYAQLF